MCSPKPNCGTVVTRQGFKLYPSVGNQGKHKEPKGHQSQPTQMSGEPRGLTPETVLLVYPRVDILQNLGLLRIDAKTAAALAWYLAASRGSKSTAQTNGRHPESFGFDDSNQPRDLATRQPLPSSTSIWRIEFERPSLLPKEPRNNRFMGDLPVSVAYAWGS